MANILSDPILLSVVGLTAILVVGPSAWGLVKWLIPSRKVNYTKTIEQLKALRGKVPQESVKCLEDVCRTLFEESLK